MFRHPINSQNYPIFKQILRKCDGGNYVMGQMAEDRGQKTEGSLPADLSAARLWQAGASAKAGERKKPPCALRTNSTLSKWGNG